MYHPYLMLNELPVLTYVLICCTTVAIVVFEYKKRKMMFKRGAQQAIYGPPQIPLLGNIYQLTTRRKHRLTKYFNLYMRWKRMGRGVFGVHVILNPVFIFIGVPAYLEAVLGNIKTAKKAEEYRILSESPLGGGLISQPDVDVWRVHRKIITPMFHFNILKTYIPIFFQETTILIEKIKTKLGKNNSNRIYVPDIRPFVELSAFDMILRNAFGVNIEAQNNESHSFLNAMSESAEIIQQRIVKPYLFLDVLFWISGYKSRLEHLKKIVYKFTEKVIQEKRQKYQRTKQPIDPNGIKSKGHDIINKNLAPNENILFHKSFVELVIENEDNEEEKMTDEEIRDNMITIMFTGQDTTSTANCLALLMLALHPEIQTQVLAEIDSVFGGPDSDNGRTPSHAEIMELHVLERIIKETTRLYPSAPTIARAITEDTPVGPFMLPQGSSMGIFIYALHRDPDLHVKPGDFWPDRFLPHNSHLIQRYTYIPFGAGSRNCVGQKYAMFQMKVLLSTLLRRYCVSTDKNIQSVRDVDELIDIGMTLKLDKCPVILTERSNSDH